MLEIYKKELQELTDKMNKAEKFAKKFPTFEKFIIENKITGEQNYINFGERYENLRLKWGICRGLYKDNSNITNCKKEYSGYLFNIYFNTLSIYDSHNDYDLEKLSKIKGVFFYDGSNSTFYIKDEGIDEFLKEAVKWYKRAIELLQKERKVNRKKELEKELNELENTTHN